MSIKSYKGKAHNNPIPIRTLWTDPLTQEMDDTETPLTFQVLLMDTTMKNVAFYIFLLVVKDVGIKEITNGKLQFDKRTL